MLTNMTTAERERLAHAEGFTEAASLLARLDDAEVIAEAAEDKIETLEAVLHDAQIDRDLYHDALTEILRGVERGEMTANNCMMLAARVLP